MLAEILEPQNQFAARFFWFRLDAIIVAIGYLLGSIPFGYLVARARGIDIRQHGSGNIGATNVLRTLGKGPGLTVFACDALKGLIAVLIGSHIATDPHNIRVITEAGHAYQGANLVVTHTTYFVRLPEAVGSITAAIACIIGHNFPIWLGFKGGKGMATSAGVLIGMMPSVAVSCLTLWFIVFKATRYVSLASIAAAIMLPVSTMVFLLLGYMRGWPYFYFAVAACLLAVWRHRSNIVRLANGTENRFEKKPKAEAAEPPAAPPAAQP
ncbi:MAG TPA: glycerol-3-phosphate 1-O-acyltransferase PlsY [Chthoniobacteraceae bacterium]|jgi:glycerol-3-phosphate acyltransferase PlsY|nr:glycerol-3-phosphate 1-O-acyltransferase PlsY [Chthoniobacteraceae bacterium]